MEEHQFLAERLCGHWSTSCNCPWRLLIPWSGAINDCVVWTYVHDDKLAYLDVWCHLNLDMKGL